MGGPRKCLQLLAHGCLLLLQLCGRDASDTQRPAALGCTPVWGGEREAGCFGASLGSSPARVGARLASEGWGAPVYSSSRQRCRESWLSAWPEAWVGQGRVQRPRSPWQGPPNRLRQPIGVGGTLAPLKGPSW